MAEKFPRFDLTGQTVLVTGAARGLGRACALACAKAGADIALGLRDVKSGPGQELAAEIKALGRKVLPLQMDVAKLDQIESAIAQAESHFGKIDVLVNNAGIGPENLAENVNEADFDATLAVNLKGTFFAAPGGRAAHDQAQGRLHRQYELPGRHRGAEGRADLLHDQGRPSTTSPAASPMNGRSTISASMPWRRPSSGPTARSRRCPIRRF